MQFWSDDAQGSEPLHARRTAAHEGLVKLNTNEWPLPPSPRAIDAMREAAGDSAALSRSGISGVARQRWPRYHGVAPENVFVGNSSDEVLAHVFVALLKHDRPLLVAGCDL